MSAHTASDADFRAPTPLKAALQSAVVWQIGWPILYSLIIPACQPCSDIMSLSLLISTASFWLFVSFVCLARRRQLSRVDLFLISHGIPCFSILALLVFVAAYYFHYGSFM